MAVPNFIKITDVDGVVHRILFASLSYYRLEGVGDTRLVFGVNGTQNEIVVNYTPTQVDNWLTGQGVTIIAP